MAPAIARALDGRVYPARDGVERFLADTSENWEELRRYRAYIGRGAGLRVAGLSE